MYVEDKAHYSLIQKLKTEFQTELEVKDSFPKEELLVPTLSVNLVSVDFTNLQIGDYNNIRELSWVIDVFALNKTQRNQIVFKLFYILEKKIPIYDYDLGFPPQSIPEIGSLTPTRLRIEFIEVQAEKPEDLYYRAAGIYTAEIQTY